MLKAILYASFKRKISFSVDKNEMRDFIAILLISGYSVVPQRRMMWEQSEDVHSSAVSQLMNRDRFDEILRYFHLADISNLAASDQKSGHFMR